MFSWQMSLMFTKKHEMRKCFTSMTLQRASLSSLQRIVRSITLQKDSRVALHKLDLNRVSPEIRYFNIFTNNTRDKNTMATTASSVFA